MLTHPTMERLQELGLRGMADAFAEQLANPTSQELDFVERFTLLVEREATLRSSRRMERRLKEARLRHDAIFEDIDLRLSRKLDRRLVLSLADSQWVTRHRNVLITGPTGIGKSFIACALANKACRDGHTVLYHRLPRLLGELALAKVDGTYGSKLGTLARARVLVLDDWGLHPLTEAARRDLLELLEDRYGRGSTVVTSQLRVAGWHEAIGDPTLADAILDRLVHNAHRLELDGPSVRKAKAEKDAG